jgi:hypothetical protein
MRKAWKEGWMEVAREREIGQSEKEGRESGMVGEREGRGLPPPTVVAGRGGDGGGKQTLV